MLRSKDPKDYFEVALSQIKPGIALDFDLQLYFPRNQHIIMWRPKGEALGEEFLTNAQLKGIEKVWIHNDDLAKYEKHINYTAEVDALTATPEPEPPKAEAQTKEGAALKEILSDPNVPDEKKKEAAAMIAKDMLSRTANQNSIKDQKKANEQARKSIEDLLAQTAAQMSSAASEIWKLGNVDAELGHAVNVATYAVIFAMAFGRIDVELLSDIALAGLLHDIGFSQISSKVASIPLKEMSRKDLMQYANHVPATVALLEELAPEIPQRVRTLIAQHHEKFDGSGFPKGLKGFKVDDIAQLVGMANLLDDMSTGHWDGKKRTLKDTFETLTALEKTRTFPEHFNPEVFAAVVRWIKDAPADDVTENAMEMVGKKVDQIIYKKEA
jgi:HD-GYP domain-containing protein (c-di-GMP phosphodiesterase class II)